MQQPDSQRAVIAKVRAVVSDRDRVRRQVIVIERLEEASTRSIRNPRDSTTVVHFQSWIGQIVEEHVGLIHEVAVPIERYDHILELRVTGAGSANEANISATNREDNA